MTTVAFGAWILIYTVYLIAVCLYSYMPAWSLVNDLYLEKLF